MQFRRVFSSLKQINDLKRYFSSLQMFRIEFSIKNRDGIFIDGLRYDEVFKKNMAVFLLAVKKIETR